MSEVKQLIAEARQEVLSMDYARAYQYGLVGRLADALEALDSAPAETEWSLECLRPDGTWGPCAAPKCDSLRRKVAYAPVVAIEKGGESNGN